MTQTPQFTDAELREVLAKELEKVNCPHAAARVTQGFAVFYPTDVAAIVAMRLICTRAREAALEEVAKWHDRRAEELSGIEITACSLHSQYAAAIRAKIGEVDGQIKG